jgi:hypothetical protein
MEGATCWIVAKHALLHIEKHHTQIEMVFQCHNIEKSQYAVYAGFDESCIRDGLGFLEQIHIFTLSTILVTSPLLVELGKILSPFSSILFTNSSSFLLPVYKTDGTIWDWDDFVFNMTSKYINHGSTAALCPTVISSQTMTNKADESQKDSEAEDGDRQNVRKEDSKRSQDKGKERARDNHDNSGDTPRDGDHDSGHPGNSGDGDEGPDDPDPEGTKETTNSPDIRFQIRSKIYTNGNLSEPSQEINTIGNLTMQVCSLFTCNSYINLIKCCIDV